MRATIIEWDGTQVPDDLKQLPPGRYLLSDPYLDDDEMTEEEEEGIRLALDQVEAGEVVPYDDVIRELRSRYADDAARIRP